MLLIMKTFRLGYLWGRGVVRGTSVRPLGAMLLDGGVMDLTTTDPGIPLLFVIFSAIPVIYYTYMSKKSKNQLHPPRLDFMPDVTVFLPVRNEAKT